MSGRTCFRKHRILRIWFALACANLILPACIAASRKAKCQPCIHSIRGDKAVSSNTWWCGGFDYEAQSYLVQKGHLTCSSNFWYRPPGSMPKRSQFQNQRPQAILSKGPKPRTRPQVSATHARKHTSSPGQTWPQNPSRTERRGSSSSAGCTENQAGRPILRPFHSSSELTPSHSVAILAQATFAPWHLGIIACPCISDGLTSACRTLRRIFRASMRAKR
jgi:hypothetical protein